MRCGLWGKGLGQLPDVYQFRAVMGSTANFPFNFNPFYSEANLASRLLPYRPPPRVQAFTATFATAVLLWIRTDAHTTLFFHHNSLQFEFPQPTPSPTLPHSSRATPPRQQLRVAFLARLLPLAHVGLLVRARCRIGCRHTCCHRARTFSAGRPPTQPCQLFSSCLCCWALLAPPAGATVATATVTAAEDGATPAEPATPEARIAPAVLATPATPATPAQPASQKSRTFGRKM